MIPITKNVLLCVTGGIAAYKALSLTSALTKKGCSVTVAMTEGAEKFVSPLSFKSLSKNEVYTNLYSEPDPQKIAHIDLPKWADIILIAPASANTISKLAAGIGDNLVTTLVLAATCKVFIAPAMNVHMYENKIIQHNIQKLQRYGFSFIEPGEGALACGDVGRGRLEEPNVIADMVEAYLTASLQEKYLEGHKVVITAGPTREPLDPFRFITNHSSGKMGYALAEAAYHLGASVTLISGPVHIAPPPVRVIPVTTASEMRHEVLKVFDSCDILIKAAAVSDYRPKECSAVKIKKKEDSMALELVKNADIIKEAGMRKTSQYIVGFAAETHDLEAYAKEKLLSKNLDMIVANNISHSNAGFGTDRNTVTIFKKDGSVFEISDEAKIDVAYKIFELIKDLKK